ncbi:fasciclin domain-containing protein [Nocardioides sp. zg-536]|uniref:Fasciclin domain-containing protein n=1 Tax=Nocardioides faecalis TaxID=2803858 RepID=A0A938Y5Z7_9ACTN|nr:fasciclin domain-containing protein [Nocardioides faecalis]MBM9459839.1 fasciclin domain-containing protein [Nocardioides faecalis]MBS4754470.1 fasciclin domain-containing protein [Nocardioides faecalis]QVI58920.1 fasciclin domain-containing protein [Nocardioides faecalis]
MKLHTLRRNAGIATAVLALSLSFAACGSEDDGNDSASSSKSSESSESPSDDMSSESSDMGADPAAQVFGDGCDALPTDGKGSLKGMVSDPVATAASNNPLLSTLVTAVTSIDGLPDTLNSAEELTVFAPTNDAFAEIPEADLNALVKAGQEQGQESDLYKILAHHVVGKNADKDAVVGDHTTLAEDKITVEGDAESGMTVTDGTVTAKVVCGNIPTANGTVYVIDKVLTGVK